MKVVSPKEMMSIESHAYEQGYSESDFMENAGASVSKAVASFASKISHAFEILLLCGKGNNGGDAYVAGRYLLEMGYRVRALQVGEISECSPLCQFNQKKFIDKGGCIRRYPGDLSDIFQNIGIIVDGFFGTGFRGAPEEPYASLIHAANQSNIPMIAVDIPSGLNGETGETPGEVILAEETVFLGLPKRGFFLNEGWNSVGRLVYGDFGLPKKYIPETKAACLELLTKDFVRPLLPKIIRNRHKYQSGLVVALAGSPGMPGAALLSSLAALRGGAGILRLLIPKGMESEMGSFPFEVIKISYELEKFEEVLAHLNRASAVFIGPGIGLDDAYETFLAKIMLGLQRPCVIDASALALIAKGKVSIPKKSILTPHKGEMLRLLGLQEHPLNEEFLQKCQKFAEEKEITLILKGAPTFIFEKNHPILINPTGDPGMATAGSGDVLTGLLAALLAQKLQPREAAALGVYLHGIAGEQAAKVKTSRCMIASDLIEFFPQAYKTLMSQTASII